MFDKFLSPYIECKCGNKMYFPNGYYPEYFTCFNCGEFYELSKIKVNYPNQDLKRPVEEIVKESFIEAVKETKKKNLKVIK